MSTKHIADISIEHACQHTIKKFELIENYTQDWAMKLLQYPNCKGIIFIDCMCNSGVYTDSLGNRVFGTPIRISKLIAEIMPKFPNKHAYLYFNDISKDKISILDSHLPKNSENLHIYTSYIDGNRLLKEIQIKKDYNYLLVYDPYVAAINWDALKRFINSWGEIILNHMVSDVVRGLPQAKRPNVISKYEETYKSDFDELLSFNGDKNGFEQKIKDILINLRSNNEKPYYISSFPFFNSVNSLVYNLIHCSGNINGFTLFKQKAWQTFGKKSSLKNINCKEQQLKIDLTVSEEVLAPTDDNCYTVQDIAKFVNDEFRGQKDVSFDDVYKRIEEHPIFPVDGFKKDIKNCLASFYKVTINKNSMTFR